MSASRCAKWPPRRNYVQILLLKKYHWIMRFETRAFSCQVNTVINSCFRITQYDHVFRRIHSILYPWAYHICGLCIPIFQSLRSSRRRRNTPFTCGSIWSQTQMLAHAPNQLPSCRRWWTLCALQIYEMRATKFGPGSASGHNSILR